MYTTKQLQTIDTMKNYWTQLLFNYQDSLPENGIITYPEVRFDRATCRAGKADYYGTYISLSNHFLETEGEFYKTIGHECAHAFVNRLHGYSQKHNHVWKRAMISIGLPPVRCHSYENTVHRDSTRWILCKCGQSIKLGAKVIRNIQAGRNYRCGKCKSLLVGELLLTKPESVLK